MQLVSYYAKLNIIADDELANVKIALLKFFYDKGFYFNVEFNLEKIYNEFTLNKIIGIWARDKVDIYDEKAYSLSVYEQAAINKVLKNKKYSLVAESGGIIGRIYEKTLSSKQKKTSGITYTTEDMCEYISELSRKKIDINGKYIDPACGCGVFLEMIYDRIIANIYDAKENTLIYEVHKKILSECIYGCDTSDIACAVAKIVLALKYNKFVLCKNIIQKDSLVDTPNDWLGKFDLVISNPPYVGHKQISSQYRMMICEKYKEVFYDKADLFYCFFVLGKNLLKENGTLIYITGRYFAQSKFAMGLRKYILDNFVIEKVIDFYGMRPFKSAGVDPMIMQLKSTSDNKDYEVHTVRFKTEINNIYDIIREDNIELINTHVSELDEFGFNFLSEYQRDIQNKVEQKTIYCLGDIFDFYQGIITGCDKAFVVNCDFDKYKEALAECGKKWIKSSELKKNTTSWKEKYILYTDSEEYENMPKTIERLNIYKEKLLSRRECASGSRKWYKLQWGRSPEIFEGNKIIFPYKSAESRFAYDKKGYYFSADIYAMKPKKGYEKYVDCEKITMLLNSKIYEEYFRTFAKKLGGKLYEYYPNTVSKIQIPKIDTINSFECEKDIEVFFGIQIQY